MHNPTFVFIFILFLKNILLLLLYPKHVIKLLGYNLGCFTDNLRLGEILPVVHSRDSPATWSTSIHSVE